MSRGDGVFDVVVVGHATAMLPIHHVVTVWKTAFVAVYDVVVSF